MDIVSAVLIAAGAAIGLLMLINLLKGHHIPKALTIIHGGLVGTGLILLLIYNIIHPEFANWISAALFIISALGGIYILFHDIKHQKVPLLIIFIHAGVAISGLLILFYKINQFHRTT